MAEVIPQPQSQPDLLDDNIDQDRKDIKRGSTLNIFGFLARLCARIPFLFTADRLYGTEHYGAYVLLTAIVETTALLSSFGLKRTIFQFIEEDARNCQKMVRHALCVVILLSIVLVAIIQSLAMPILQVFSASSAYTNLLILSWAIPFISLADVFLSTILSKRIMRYEIAVRSFVEPILLTLLSLLSFLRVGLRLDCFLLS